jgi:hypothetical protein
MSSVVDLLRPIPIPGEVLIVEDRNCASTGTKNFEDFLKELVPRILCLRLFVARIPAVLAYQDDAIDREFTAA